MKRLHPSLVEETASVPEDLYDDYVAERDRRDQAVVALRLAENRMREIMGDAKWLSLPDGRGIGTRSVYDVKERTQHVKAYTVDKLTIRDEPKDPAAPKRAARSITAATQPQEIPA